MGDREGSAGPPAAPALRPGPVYLTVLAIASCGLVYELVAGALASYLLGDSVTQFSLVIGVYLTALGLGAFLSRGSSCAASRGDSWRRRSPSRSSAGSPRRCSSSPSPRRAGSRPSSTASSSGSGRSSASRFPLLMRLLKDTVVFRDLVAQVLTFDYLGALAASILFPLVFLPRLGLTRTSVLFGLLNAAVAFWSIRLFREPDRAAGRPLRAGRTGHGDPPRAPSSSRIASRPSPRRTSTPTRSSSPRRRRTSASS